MADNKLIARRFYESYNDKDIQKSFDDYIADDLINHTMGGSFDREKWLHFDTAVLSACPDLQLEVKDQFSEGSKVITLWTCNGTHTEEFFGMPASENPIKLTGVSIDGFENGKIKEHFSFMDYTEFMQQFEAKW